MLINYQQYLQALETELCVMLDKIELPAGHTAALQGQLQAAWTRYVRASGGNMDAGIASRMNSIGK